MHEAFGGDFQLPNRTAYNETCANIGNAMCNWRMLQITGDAPFPEGTISQRLLQRADKSGRVVACEIMRQTKTIQECIADPSKTFMLKEYNEKGNEFYQMQTFVQHLGVLYRGGVITVETAKSVATSAADFERSLNFQ